MIRAILLCGRICEDARIVPRIRLVAVQERAARPGWHLHGHLQPHCHRSTAVDPFMFSRLFIAPDHDDVHKLKPWDPGDTQDLCVPSATGPRLWQH